MADDTGLTFNQYSVLVTHITDVKTQLVKTETQLLSRMDEQYERMGEQSRKHDIDLRSHNDRINSLERLRLWFFFGIVVLVCVVVIGLLVGFIIIQGLILRGAP